ncbi:MAG TPA: hypothetical protein VNN73_06710 [Blastocatellia bacterium]|nr:hypothetical protein [Blastocatellia bacterium]
MNKLKGIIASVFVIGIIALLASQTVAFPPFLAKAKKFGAKDCRFCHVKAEGGEPFNARGKWLIKEKERRKANEVDPEWLAGYKKKSKK